MGRFAIHAGAQSDQSQPQISRGADLILSSSSHAAEAAFKHANRCCSLAGSIDACLGLSAEAAQPRTFPVCLWRNETSLCNSLMALKAFETVRVSSLYQTFLLFVFCKLNNQGKDTFPFVQGIAFLLRSFHTASLRPCLFAGAKDVIPLRCSQDPSMTGRL